METYLIICGILLNVLGCGFIGWLLGGVVLNYIRAVRVFVKIRAIERRYGREQRRWPLHYWIINSHNLAWSANMSTMISLERSGIGVDFRTGRIRRNAW